MSTHRYLLSAIALSLCTGLLACGQPEATNRSASDPPFQENYGPAQAGPAQADPAQADPAQADLAQAELQGPFDDGCINLLVYDPEDTSVNVRDRPNGSIVDTLPNLTRIQPIEGPIGLSTGWREISVVGTETIGYVHSDLIRRTTLSVMDPDDNSANLRSSPDGPVITAVPNETIVRFLGSDDSWTQVELQTDDTGYIATSLLSATACN